MSFRVFFAIVMSAMGAGQASAFAPDYGKGKAAAAYMFSLFDRKVNIDSFSEDGDKIVSQSTLSFTRLIHHSSFYMNFAEAAFL